MSNDFKLCYIRRRVVEWCSIRYDIMPFKRLIQEHYWESTMKVVQYDKKENCC